MNYRNILGFEPHTVERWIDGTPRALRIWEPGPSRNANFEREQTFDEESARLLLEQQRRFGNRYSFDYDHLSLDPSSTIEQRRSAGSFVLEVRSTPRGPELWAADIKWTEEARRGITSGHWQSVSPAYGIDKESGRIVAFDNCSLVNRPATSNATRISLVASLGGRMHAAAKALEEPKTKTKTTNDELLLLDGNDDVEKKLAAMGMTFDEIVEALEALMSDSTQPDDVREKASRMLKTLEDQETLSARMGLPTRRSKIRHRGTRMVLGVMTPAEARAQLARRS